MDLPPTILSYCPKCNAGTTLRADPNLEFKYIYSGECSNEHCKEDRVFSCSACKNNSGQGTWNSVRNIKKHLDSSLHSCWVHNLENSKYGTVIKANGTSQTATTNKNSSPIDNMLSEE